MNERGEHPFFRPCLCAPLRILVDLVVPMQPFTLLALLASASAFTAPVSRALPVSRVSDVRAQFGTGNYDDSQSKKGFVLSPIAGGSKVSKIDTVRCIFRPGRLAPPHLICVRILYL